MKTPKQIQKHQRDYSVDAWKEFTINELGQWVHLLAKRSAHRSDKAKRLKDIGDARNYWRMIGAHLDTLK